MNNFDPKLKEIAKGQNFGQNWNIDCYLVNVMCKTPARDWRTAGLVLAISGFARTSLSHVEDAIERLEKQGVVVPAEGFPIIHPRYKLTDEFIVFAELYEHGKPGMKLLQITIQVKGNAIALKDLADFYQHVPWLLSNYKELNEVFLGGIRLSREEAEEVINQLEEEQAFKKGS